MKGHLEETYMKERSRLLGWMRIRIGAEEAEDALHDVIVRSLINLDSLGGVRDLTAWLWQGAQNAVVDVWRKRSRHKRAGEVPSGHELAHGGDFDSFIDAAMEGAGDRLEREELLSVLSWSIEDLPASQRDVILAQALHGETFQSISKRTGVPIETLAARKRYALARLKAALSPYMEV